MIGRSMYIFIDESGVHQQDKKSVIALVYVAVQDLVTLGNAVLKIEKELGINNFHWSHSAWPVRNKFVEKIVSQNFSAKVALIKNPFNLDQAYEYALKHLVIEKDLQAIVIDGKKSRSYERKLKKVLRDKGISIKKLRTGNDESYPALRIADAIAGIVRYRNENPEKKEVQHLYNLIKSKILITLE